MQKKSRVLEQHIAVFGESGSGKTVMLSSFYGAAQEPEYIKRSLFNIVAESPGQGTHLLQNYLGMKKSAKLPAADKFSSKAYSFRVRLKDEADARAAKTKPFDALRLVWHDYPGEWFEQDVSGPEEARRRLETFRALLGSDVALLLVDGQRLLDNAGQEERYLKSLLSDFRNGLLLLKDDLLDDGKPLVTFPRIWMMALSKSDLLPDMDVFGFRDLLIEKAGADVEELRTVIGGFVESRAALSVGEDFVLLSSAKFDGGTIEVSERVGLDLILPVAAVLPFERHAQWAHTQHVSRKVAQHLLDGVEAVAAGLGALGGVVGALGKVGGKVGKVGGKVGKVLGSAGALVQQLGPAGQTAARLAGNKLKDADAKAVAKQDNLAATLSGFRRALDDAERKRILLRSLR